MRRLVSLFDTGARPIKRGKARPDTEFGRKLPLGETDQGVIATYDVLEENPSDTTLLKCAVKGRWRLFRKRLKAIAADQGLHSQANEDLLKGSGVKQVSIPERGKINGERRSYQKQSWFKRLHQFRAGIEARISLLKRKFGLKRGPTMGQSRSRYMGRSGHFHPQPLAGSRIA